jgi:hypothetical protein
MYKTTGRAKPTKHARLICTLAMISAAIGIVIGLLTGNPLWIIFFLFPAVIYEIYRTQGVSTKWASWMMLGILLAEIVLIIFNVSFDIAEFLGQETAYVGGETIRLGDIKTLGPALLAVVSMVLMLRTAGVYTKWLAGIIFVTSFALIFTLDPDQFGYLLQIALQRIFRSL